MALHDSGRGAEALSVLEKADARHPGDPDLLVALASYNHERGALALARRYGERLVALDPEDRGAQALLAQVSRPPTR